MTFLVLPDTNLFPQASIIHYSQLLTRQHSTKLQLCELIFKVPTITWGVLPGHILTNLIINWAMMTGNGENPQVYGQWTIDDPQNWLFANRLGRRRVYQHGFPGLSTSKTRVLCHLQQVENKRMKSDFNEQVSGCQPRRQSGHMVGGTVIGDIHVMKGPLE